MIMPAYSSVPESMLAPSQLLEKFNVPNFAGLRGLRGLARLGCGCSEYNDDGDCEDPDPCVTTAVQPTVTMTTGAPQPTVFPSTSPVTTSPTPVIMQTGPTAQQLALDQAILGSGTKIATILAAGGTGTSVLANGTVISPGAPVSTLGTAGGILSGSTPLLLLVAIGAVVLMSSRGH